VKFGDGEPEDRIAKLFFAGLESFVFLLRQASYVDRGSSDWEELRSTRNAGNNSKFREMKKETKPLPTDAELEVLDVLWKKGESTVREVYDIISETKKCAYTTTLKIMQKMLAKGLIRRNVNNQVHSYEAAIEEFSVRNRSVKELINKFFKGSYSQLVVHALGQSSGHENLDELEELINCLKQNKR